ncbi:MAG: lysophospholipid acyltransferase family protein [Pseudomonadota bacterium]
MTPMTVEETGYAQDVAQSDLASPPGPLDNIRALIFRVWITSITAIGGVIGIAFLLSDGPAIRWFCRQWARTVLFGLTHICGIRAAIAGRENLPTGPAIIAANHQSMWETVWLYAHLRHPIFVIKQELTQVPVFGFWLRKSGAIAIDREAGPKSIRALIRNTRQAIKSGAQIVIFPEGTRLQPGETAALKPGIAGIYQACGAPVHVVGHDSGRRWLYPGWRKRAGPVQMRIAPAIEPGLEREGFLAQLDDRLLDMRPDVTAHTPPPNSSHAALHDQVSFGTPEQ